MDLDRYQACVRTWTHVSKQDHTRDHVNGSSIGVTLNWYAYLLALTSSHGLEADAQRLLAKLIRITTNSSYGEIPIWKARLALSQGKVASHPKVARTSSTSMLSLRSTEP